MIQIQTGAILVIIASTVLGCSTPSEATNSSQQKNDTSQVITLNGNQVAEITSEGEVWIDGTKEGDITSDGEIWVAGDKEGDITDDGEIWNAGNKVGEVTSKGEVWKDGNLIGTIEDDGTIWIGSDRAGSFSGGSRNTAAAIAFFGFYKLP